MDPKTKSKSLSAAADEQPVDRQRQKPEGGRVFVAALAKEGRRRAGLEFGQAGTIVDLAEISQEQWDLILDDPQLSLRPVPKTEEAEQA